MNQEAEKWKVVESRRLMECRIFNVRQDESVSDSGNRGSFFVIENCDWVNVIPITTSQEVILIEQYRHGTEEVTIEIPGGMIEEGELPAAGARRELVEATGYTPASMVYLGRTRPNPAIQNNWPYHYLAVDCEKTAEVEFDSTEHVITKFSSQKDFQRMIADEEITHTAVLSAFARWKLS